MNRRTYVLLFASAVATFVLVSIAAYSGVLPPWVAPGNTDKVLHFTMAGALASLLDRALAGRPIGSRTLGAYAPPLASVLVLVPLGIEEILQRLSPIRSSSIFDYAADVAGVIVFTLVLRRLDARFTQMRTARQTQ